MISEICDKKPVALDLPSPTIDLFRRVFVPFDAPRAIRVIDLKLSGTSPAADDRLGVVVPDLTGGNADDCEN